MQFALTLLLRWLKLTRLASRLKTPFEKVRPMDQAGFDKLDASRGSQE